jgi:hypothetical protein
LRQIANAETRDELTSRKLRIIRPDRARTGRASTLSYRLGSDLKKILDRAAGRTGFKRIISGRPKKTVLRRLVRSLHQMKCSQTLLNANRLIILNALKEKSLKFFNKNFKLQPKKLPINQYRNKIYRFFTLSLLKSNSITLKLQAIFTDPFEVRGNIMSVFKILF